jgi:parallel beta-helix repeat protein
MGFDVGDNSTVQGCNASSNKGDGIHILSGTLVSNNTCNSNGLGGDGAGIHAINPDNRLEANNLINNDRGIDVDAAGNFIIRNSASGNTTNYDLVANNLYGAIVDRAGGISLAVTGNSAGTSIATTDPWANLSY